MAEPENFGWRDLVAAGLSHSGALSACQSLARKLQLDPESPFRVAKRKVPGYAIICYHRIGTGGVPLYSELPIQQFEEQMAYLRRRFRVISLTQMVEELADGGNRKGGVVVTFDDGYRDTYTNAYPILKKYSIPAMVYLTVGCIDSGDIAWYDKLFLAIHSAKEGATLQTLGAQYSIGGSKLDRLKVTEQIISRLRKQPNAERVAECERILQQLTIPAEEATERMLTWQQVREMMQGGVEFGCHTMTHPVVARLSVSEIQLEIERSKRLMEDRVQQHVQHFAYPFGKADECLAEDDGSLKRIGFSSATTTEYGMVGPGVDLFRLSRMMVSDEKSLALFAYRLTRFLWEPVRAQVV